MEKVNRLLAGGGQSDTEVKVSHVICLTVKVSPRMLPGNDKLCHCRGIWCNHAGADALSDPLLAQDFSRFLAAKPD